MVKAKVESVEDAENKRLVHVEVEPEMMKQHMNMAFQKLRQEVEIPGFRKGKVPRSLFEQRFGEEAIRQEALENLIPQAYGQAIEQLELEPIAPPEIDLGGPNLEGGFEFTATIEVVPDVELGEYRDLDVDLDVPTITEEDVDEAVQSLLETRATVELVEDEKAELSPGMMAVISYQGLIDDEPVEDLAGEEELIELGSGNYIPGFEEGLIGAKAQEKRSFEVQFPEDAPTEDLAGREVTFEVEIHELKRKVLPELDEELLEEIGIADTLEGLRERIRDSVADSREERALSEYEQEIMSRIVGNADVSVPDVMVDDLMERRLEGFEEELENSGMTLEQFAVSRGYESVEALKEEIRGDSRQELAEMLVLDAIAECEEVEVDREELDEGMRKRAAQMGIDANVLRQMSMRGDYTERLRSEVRYQKTRRLLASWSDSEYDELRDGLEERRARLKQEMEERQEKQLDKAAEPGEDLGKEQDEEE